jgi:hypothetical protein
MIQQTSHSGLTPLQKCTAALHQLAYGMPTDMIAEYLKLRRPTIPNTQRLLAKVEEHGFPCMLGNIDRMHCQWHNYPVGW